MTSSSSPPLLFLSIQGPSISLFLFLPCRLLHSEQLVYYSSSFLLRLLLLCNAGHTTEKKKKKTL